jgi:hypothetical protein
MSISLNIYLWRVVKHTEAIKNDTMEPSDYVFKDYWSEGLTFNEKMGPYFRSLDVST